MGRGDGGGVGEGVGGGVLGGVGVTAVVVGGCGGAAVVVVLGVTLPPGLQQLSPGALHVLMATSEHACVLGLKHVPALQRRVVVVVAVTSGGGVAIVVAGPQHATPCTGANGPALRGHCGSQDRPHLTLQNGCELPIGMLLQNSPM